MEKYFALIKNFIKRVINNVGCTLILTISGKFSYAQHEMKKLELLWEAKYEYSDNVLSILKCKQSGVIVLTKSLDDLLKIRKIDENGNTLWDSSYNGFKNLGLLSNNVRVNEDKYGNFFVVFNTKDRSPVLAKFDSVGTIIFMNKIQLNSIVSKLYVQSFLINDKEICLFGVNGNKDFCKLCLKATGEFLAIGIFEAGANNIVTDIFIKNDSEPIVITKSGHFDKYGGGESVLNIYSIDTIRMCLNLEVSFSGKNGKMHSINNSNYLLVYDSLSTFPEQKIDFTILNKDFKVIKSERLIANQIGTSISFINEADSGKLAISSVKGFNSFFCVINKKGSIEGQFESTLDSVISIEQVFFYGTNVYFFYKYIGKRDTDNPLSILKRKIVSFRYKL